MSGSRAITVGMDVPTSGSRDVGRNDPERTRSGCVRDGFTGAMAGCLWKVAGDKFSEIFEARILERVTPTDGFQLCRFNHSAIPVLPNLLACRSPDVSTAPCGRGSAKPVRH